MKRLKNLVFAVVLGTVLISALTVTAGAVVTESSGNGKALYNGVMLSDINTVWTDKVTYPYAVILRVADAYVDVLGVDYFLYLCQSASVSGDSLTIKGAEFVLIDNQWELSTSTVDGSLSENLAVAIWTSRNILNEDGSVYLSASDPISLDGMNVITWDGDTTGLSSFSQDYYKVLDYFPVSGSTYSVISSPSSLLTLEGAIFDGALIDSPGWFNSADYLSSSVNNVVGLSEDFEGLSSGIYFLYESISDGPVYSSLFAYPSSELPPDEGSVDIDFSGSSLHVVDVERSFDVLSYEVSWSDLPVVPYPDNVQYFIRGTLSDGSPTQSIYIGSSSDPPSGSVPVFFEFEDLSPSTEYTVTFELAYNTTASTNGPFTSSGVTVTDISTTTSDSDISDGDKAIINAIDNANKDNQQWLDNQYNEAVGDLPEDTASTDAMIGDLDLKEEAYKNDAFDRFQELSSAFTGFDGDVASGIGLAGTLFSRFFNALGSYKIIYTFPLLLGLALVIIGRLGRSGGPRSGRDHEVPGQFKMDSW